MKRAVWILLFIILTISLTGDELVWKRIGPIAPTISRITADRIHPGIWFLTESTRQRLYRSSNNGESWNYTGLIGVSDVLVHPANSEVYAVVPGRPHKRSLFSSKDSGRSFQLRSANSPARIFGHPSDPKILWGSGLPDNGYNLSVSTDRGAHWQGFTNLPFQFDKEYPIEDWGNLSPDSYYLQSVLVSPFDNKTVYVSTEVEFDVGCSYEAIDMEMVSTNSGKTWSYKIQPLGNYFYDASFRDRAFFANRVENKILTARGWQPMQQRRFEQIVSVPGKRNVLYALTERKQWISRDEGRSWRLTELGPNGNARLIQARSFPEGSLIAGTSGGGVYVIDENRNWHETAKGMRESSLFDVAAAPGSKFVYAIAAAGDSYLYRSSNSGQSWQNISDKVQIRNDPDFRLYVVVNPKNGRNVYLILDRKVAVSFNAGDTWSEVPQGQLNNVFFDPNSDATYFARLQSGRLYKSDDGGKTVRELPALLGHQKSTVLDVAVDPFNRHLYIGTTHGLYISKNQGMTAEQIGTEIFPECIQCPDFRQIIALPVQGQYLARADSFLYKSINQGVTWRKLSVVAGNIYVADTKGNHLFEVGGSLRESLDGGQSWEDIGKTVHQNLPWDDTVMAMTDPRHQPIYLATTFGMFQTR